MTIKGGIKVEQRGVPNFSDIFEKASWSLKNKGKVNINSECDLNNLFGKKMYICGVGTTGPFSKTTFISEIGKDENGPYFKINEHREGATLFFDKEEANIFFGAIKAKYIEQAKKDFQSLVAEIQDLQISDENPIYKKDNLEIITSLVPGLNQTEQIYSQELKNQFEIGQEVFIVKAPREHQGISSGISEKHNLSVLGTTVRNISINKNLEIVYELKNGDLYKSSQLKKEVFFSSDEALQEAKKLQQEFPNQYNHKVSVQTDKTKEEKDREVDLQLEKFLRKKYNR